MRSMRPGTGNKLPQACTACSSPTPTARVAKSMLYLLSRSSPEVAGVNPEGFIEARYINELESSGFFDEMNRLYAK